MESQLLMGLTFVEKVLARAAGLESVRAGQIIDVEPDYLMSHDNAAAILKTFTGMGLQRVAHPERIVIILDHCVPASSEEHAKNHRAIREFVRAQGIPHFFDINAGICHQVFSEQGFATPGGVILGSDSHTTTYGAFGAFSAGIGRSGAWSRGLREPAIGCTVYGIRTWGKPDAHWN